MYRHLHLVLIFFITLAGTYAQTAGQDYPKSFHTDKMEIPTLQEYLTHVKTRYPETSTSTTPVLSVEYKSETFPGLLVETRGLVGGYKTNQSLTYIKLHDGLWKLLFVNGETCTKGTVLREGKWTETWICEEIVFPVISAALFVIENQDVDLAKLSQDWGQIVSLNSAKNTEEKHEDILTLADMKHIMISKGASWSTTELTWTGMIKPIKPDQPALLIEVSGTQAGNPIIKYHHTFLYVLEGQHLKLKEIEGEYCHYEALIKKDLCEKIYTPTPVAPFKLVLVNSDQRTSESENSSNSEQSTSQSAIFSCGNIGANYDLALMLHFKHSRFSSRELEGYKKAVARLPEVADPKGLFLSDADKGFYKSISQNDDLVTKLVTAVNQGPEADCDDWIPLVERLKSKVLSRSSDLHNLMNFLKSRGYQKGKLLSESSELNPWQESVLNFILNNTDPLLESFPEISIDIAAGQILSYYTTTLRRISSYEEIITASMVHLDKFSNLLDPQPQAKSSSDGSKKYFGISVLKGAGHHYIYKVLNAVSEVTDLKPGDMVEEINGLAADNMSAVEVDNILLNTRTSISLKIKRQERSILVNLNARTLDVLKPYYSTELIQGANQRLYLKIKVNLFIEGITESIFKSITTLLQNRQPLSGIILDLQSNPGGRVTEAVKLISFFVKGRNILFQRVGLRGQASVRALNADSSMLISETLPLIVEVNSASASSSELVASSLKALNRSITIGARTFGKYVAQSYFPSPLSSGENFVMAVTSTEFYDPNGKTYNSLGLDPDIKIFSKKGGVFQDGNGTGNDYDVPKGEQPETYQSFISSVSLLKIQDSIIIDQTSADAVAVEILDEAI